jgi:hypothetical protein
MQVKDRFADPLPQPVSEAATRQPTSDRVITMTIRRRCGSST